MGVFIYWEIFPRAFTAIRQSRINVIHNVRPNNTPYPSSRIYVFHPDIPPALINAKDVIYMLVKT